MTTNITLSKKKKNASRPIPHVSQKRVNIFSIAQINYRDSKRRSRFWWGKCYLEQVEVACMLAYFVCGFMTD